MMHEGAARVHPAIAFSPEECIITWLIHARPLINPVHSYDEIYALKTPKIVLNFTRILSKRLPLLIKCKLMYMSKLN